MLTVTSVVQSIPLAQNKLDLKATADERNFILVSAKITLNPKPYESLVLNHKSHRLNSLNGGYIRDYRMDYYRGY